jgi:hypothetical protein
MPLPRKEHGKAVPHSRNTQGLGRHGEIGRTYMAASTLWRLHDTGEAVATAAEDVRGRYETENGWSYGGVVAAEAVQAGLIDRSAVNGAPNSRREGADQ